MAESFMSPIRIHCIMADGTEDDIDLHSDGPLPEWFVRPRVAMFPERGVVMVVFRCIDPQRFVYQETDEDPDVLRQGHFNLADYLMYPLYLDKIESP
jgi:hypothetical protein